MVMKRMLLILFRIVFSANINLTRVLEHMDINKGLSTSNTQTEITYHELVLKKRLALIHITLMKHIKPLSFYRLKEFP